ncbi:Tyrosine recombinase XerC [subsurface metagenome]
MSAALKTLTADECDRLLNALRVSSGTSSQCRRGIRNYTLALVMLDAGLRVSEATGLEVTDLWFNNAPVTSLIVRPEIAKNHRERSIPVSPRLKQALEDFFKHGLWLSGPESNRKVFCSGHPPRQITRRQVHRIVTAASLRSLGRSVHPHILRHTFASRLMRVTSMRTVQELLGHMNITSTQIYTHPNEQDKHNAIENMDRSEESDNPTPY